MRRAARSSRGIAAFGVILAAVVTGGVLLLSAPALWAQESTGTEAPSASEAAPTPPTAEAPYPEPSVPPTTVVAQAQAAAPGGEGTGEEPAVDQISVNDLAAKPIDQQLVRFRADLARRMHPKDRAEMISNEHTWYRNLQQLEFNGLPSHKQLPAECGQDWWAEYCGN